MRFLLDTNIVSEWMKPTPQAAVLASIHTHRLELAMPVITWCELRYGLQRLPAGAKRQRLEDFLHAVVEPAVPVLPYDRQAADWHAASRARLVGRGITPSFPDGQIAAVAAVHGLVLASRNERDFRGFDGLVVENWFNS